MNRATVLSIVCALVLVNPAFARTRKIAKRISTSELAAYLISTGDSAVRPLGTGAALLGFPGEQSVNVRGDSTDTGEIGSNLEGDCDVVVDGPDAKPHPVCLLVNYLTFHPAEHRLVGQTYRFSLDGHLEYALHMNAKLNDKGDPVAGSAENSPLDIKDKETIAGARKALDIWLNRTAKKIAAEKAKKKAAKK